MFNVCFCWGLQFELGIRQLGIQRYTADYDHNLHLLKRSFNRDRLGESIISNTSHFAVSSLGFDFALQIINVFFIQL